MPVFVISLLSQFVYQPVISKMALLWHEKKISQFNKLILRQIALILLLSVAAIIGGYLLGIPVLSLIYGVDLTDYKKSLVILLIGGGALAIVNFLQMIITVARKQTAEYRISVSFFIVCFWWKNNHRKAWNDWNISFLHSSSHDPRSGIYCVDDRDYQRICKQ